MLGEMLVGKERDSWRGVPELAIALADCCKTAAADLQLLGKERCQDFIDAWYVPDQNFLMVNLSKTASEACVQHWADDLGGLPYDWHIFTCESYHPRSLPANLDPPIVKIAMRPYAAVAYHEKKAYSANLRKLLSMTGWNEDLFKTPEWPSPAAAMLASGLLGAGAGYGAGMIGENILPERWNRDHKLRHSLAMAGGLAGVLPGALWAGANIANDKGILSHYPMPDDPPQEIKTAEGGYPWWETPVHHIGGSGDENDTPPQSIDVHQFNQVIWHDPYVSQQLTPQIQALATGLVTGASHLAGEGGPATLISPWDVAKMTAGMGTGYVSGAVVGKALGMLMGMPEDSQDRLKQTGMWAGAITNIIPRAFGGG